MKFFIYRIKPEVKTGEPWRAFFPYSEEYDSIVNHYKNISIWEVHEFTLPESTK